MPKFKVKVEGYKEHVTDGPSRDVVAIRTVLDLRECGVLRKGQWPNMKVPKA